MKTLKRTPYIQSLVNNYIHVEKSDTNVLIYATIIDWPLPHSPKTDTKLVKTLAPNSPEEDIDLAIDSVLANPRFFTTCKKCNTLNLMGHMLDDELCLDCAEQQGTIF
ncbi:hypothetical protein [Thalassotalea aquiviva]|uniref:hypothetical protein n=1 Tax=Thalassotalea aquiviva TaxID=3242415 RepID=UPI003529FA28